MRKWETGREKTANTCQGFSAWDEPCTRPATRYCKECGRLFCDAHLTDADWHPYAAEWPHSTDGATPWTFPIRPVSLYHDVSFSPLHTVQLLNLIDHEFVEPLLIGSLHLDKNVRYAPTSLRVSYTLQPSHCRHDVTGLTRSSIDKDIRSHAPHRPRARFVPPLHMPNLGVMVD